MTDQDQQWFPLTQAQKDFWEEYQAHKDTPVSTVAHYIDIEGPADQDALIRAITQIIQETDVLSLRFKHIKGTGFPHQNHSKANGPKLQIFDLRTEPKPLQNARLMMQADISQGVDLLDYPISAQWLMRVSEDRWLWYNRGHHIILDGYGIVLVEQRCAQLYNHYAGRPEAGDALLSYTEYLAEEEGYLESKRFEKDKGFWQGYLQDTPKLPTLQKGSENCGARGVYKEQRITSDLQENILAAERITGIGWPDIVSLLSGAYLLKYEQSAPLSERVLPVWIPYMNRIGSISVSVPSVVVNILPVLINIEDGETVEAYLKRMSATLRKVRRHGRYRIEQISIDQGIPDDKRYFLSPLVNVIPFDMPSFDHCKATRHVLASGSADGFNLTFRGASDASGLTLRLDADPDATREDEFMGHQRRLPEFLARALSSGGLQTKVDRLLPVALTT